ncbi:MAG TPA: GreA/GreB family elongation factor [Kofleriaceae bacterium]|nr:GreA/GreB family elongation factor [Kofleriaceae bacterium]
MSKAFTREDDAVPVAPVTRRKLEIPVGVPNYITAAGARALRAELAALVDGRSEAQRDEIRMHELAEHLATAELVEPTPGDQVRFGSTVELSTGARYRIVGAIEADPKRGRISWQSPLARKLIGARVGELEIVAIS